MKKNKSIFRFLLTGGSSTLIDFIIYYLLGTYIDISIAKCISMLCASIYSYFLNKRWTFENVEKTSISIILKYYITFIINMAINVGINRIVFHHAHNKLIAFIVATAIAMIVNYLLQKKWVFIQTTKEDSHEK